MAEDKKLENLQEEIKLLKGELKNSLSSVRDYLLNLDMPSSELSNVMAALTPESQSTQQVIIDSSFLNSRDSAGFSRPEIKEVIEETDDEVEEEIIEELVPPSEDEEVTYELQEPPKYQEVTSESSQPPQEPEIALELPSPSQEPEVIDESPPLFRDENPADIAESVEEVTEEIPAENSITGEENINPEDTLLPEDKTEPSESFSAPEVNYEEITPESTLSVEEEQPMEYDHTITEESQTVPKVNMLANLINWVARAKKEIGYEQLPTFLEVYGISGNLSPELKEVIIHLADITKERPEAATDADIWSQSMLSLHGILTGGDAPLHPVIPSWEETTDEALKDEEETIEVDKSKEKPLKLKLVFPNGNGKNKEFSIDFKPDEENNGSA